MARDFSSKASVFLDKASSLNRSFREETLTDILMGGMLAFDQLGIEVDFPDEPKTGADMEWMFRRKDRSSYYRLIIQAKKLGGSGRVWTRRSYPEIFHRVRSSGQLQSDLLVQEARMQPATVPLYLFYTNETVCDLAAQDGKKLYGASLVDGELINRLVNGRVKGALKVSEASSLKALQPNMKPLTKLLCSEQETPKTRAQFESGDLLFFVSSERMKVLYTGVPTPEHIRARLLDMFGSDVPSLGEGQPEAFDRRGAGHFRVTFWS